MTMNYHYPRGRLYVCMIIARNLKELLVLWATG